MMRLDVPPEAFIKTPLERIGKKLFLSIPETGYKTELPDGVEHSHDQ